MAQVNGCRVISPSEELEFYRMVWSRLENPLGLWVGSEFKDFEGRRFVLCERMPDGALRVPKRELKSAATKRDGRTKYRGNA